MRRDLDVTLRDKDHRSEIRKAWDVTPLLRIERSQLCLLVRPCVHNVSGKKSKLSPSGYIQSTPTGKRPKIRPRTRWSDYNSDLAWYRLSVEPAELFEIRIDCGVFRVVLGELSPRLSKKKKPA